MPEDKYILNVTSKSGKRGTYVFTEEGLRKNWDSLRENFEPYGNMDVYKQSDIDKDSLDPDTEYTIQATKNGKVGTYKMKGSELTDHWRPHFDNDFGEDGWSIAPQCTQMTPRYNDDGALEGFYDPSAMTRTERFDQSDEGKELKTLNDTTDTPEYRALQEQGRGSEWRVPTGIDKETPQPADTTEMWRNIDRREELQKKRDKARTYDENTQVRDDDEPMKKLAEWNAENGKYFSELQKRNTSNYEGVVEAVYGKTEEECDEDYNRLLQEHNALQSAVNESKEFRARRDNGIADLEEPYDNIKAQRDKMHWVSLYDPNDPNAGYYAYENGASANQDERNLGTAEYFLNDAKNALTADSTYRGGLKYTLRDPNTYRRLYGASNEFNLRLILDEAQKLAEQGKGWDDLSESARTALEAWNQNLAAHDLMDPTRGWDFNAGQSTVQSVRFMADMAISMGITKAAGRVALESMLSKGLLRGVERDALKDAGMTLGRALGKSWTSTAAKEGEKVAFHAAKNFMKKAAVNIGEGIVNGLGQTIASPGMILKGFADNLITYGEDGNLPTYRQAFWSSAADKAIEIWSENGAEPFWNIITEAPAALTGLAAKRFLPGAYRAMSEFFTKASASGFIRTLRAAGYQGQPEEMFEELAGATVRYITGVNKDELRDFFTWDNFKTLGISFLPITMLGGSVSMAQVGHADASYKRSRSSLAGMMRRMGYNESQTEYYLNAIKDDPSEGQAGLMSSIAEQAAASGAVVMDKDGRPGLKGDWAKLAVAMGEYRDAAARKSVFDGAWESEQNRQRRDDYDRAQEEFGGDFLNADKYDSGNGGTQFSAEDRGLAEGAELEGDVQEIAEEMADTTSAPETRKERRQKRREERRKRREDVLNSPTPDQIKQKTIENGRVSIITTTDGRRMFVLGRTENGEWAVRPADAKAEDKTVTFITDDQIRKGQAQGEDGNAREMTAEETIQAGTRSLKDFIDDRLLFNRAQQRRVRRARRIADVRQERWKRQQEIIRRYQDENGAFTGEIDGLQLANPQGNLDEGLQVVDKDGNVVRTYTWDELYAREHNGEAMPTEEAVNAEEDRLEKVEEGEVEDGGQTGNAENIETETQGQQQSQQSALERIPKDENGNPVFGPELDPSLAWDAMVEYYGGDVAGAEQDAQDLLKQKQGVLSKLEKEAKKSPKGSTMAEKRAAREALASQVEAARKEVDFWNGVVQEAQKRRNAQQNAQSQTQQTQQTQQQSENTQTQEQTQEQTENTQTENQQTQEKSAVEEMTGMTYEQIRERWGKNYADLARSLSEKAKEWGLPFRILMSRKQFDETCRENGMKVIGSDYFACGVAHNGTAYICIQDIIDYAKDPRHNIEAEQKGMETLAHEGLAHVGMKMDMGTKAFNEYCDRVFKETMTQEQREEAFAYQWDTNMTDEQKRSYLGIDDKNAPVPAWKDLSKAKKREIINGKDKVSTAIRRGAADEFIAHIAEKRQRGERLDDSEKKLWRRIVDWFRQRFGKYLTEEGIAEELARVQSRAESGTLGQAETQQETETAENEVKERSEMTGDEARKAGKWTVEGYEYTRQESHGGIRGEGENGETRVKFGNKPNETVNGHYVLVTRDKLQPSHQDDGQRNPMHFIPESQPKEDSPDRKMERDKMAVDLNPEEATRGVTAFVGTPIINTRGEVIQGNNRAMGLKIATKESMERYHDWLKKHAAEFGFTAEQIDQMGDCVLVREVDVDDKTANALGKKISQDTESGGIQQIDPARVSEGLQEKGNFGSFIESLLADNGDEGASLTDIIRANARDALSTLYRLGLINDTQVRSAYNESGGVNKDTVDMFKSLIQSALFEGGPLGISKDFNNLPNNVQNALTQTAWRTIGMKNGAEVIRDIQRAIRAYRDVGKVEKELAGVKDIDKIRNTIKSIFVQGDMFTGKSNGDRISQEAQLLTEEFFLAGKGLLYDSEGHKLKLKDVLNRVFDNMEGRMTMFEEREPMSFYNALEEAMNSDASQRFSAEERRVENERVLSEVRGQKQPGASYDTAGLDMDDLGETRFSVGERRRTEMENRLKRVRPDLTEEERNALFDYLGTLTKPNGDNDTKLQNATFNWFAKGAIRIPEDMDKVRQAVKVAERFGANTSKYDNPMELIDTFSERTGTDNPIDPDTVPTLSNKVDYGNGITVYDVDESEESRQWMRKIIDTHLGKNRNPWCLLQGDGDGNLTEDSKNYWGHYSRYGKRVAFKDGKLLAFFAAGEEDEPTWWDRQDKPHRGIPVTLKMDDGSGRSADYELVEDYNAFSDSEAEYDISEEDEDYGLWKSRMEWRDNWKPGLSGPKKIYRGNTRNGMYEDWFANGQLRQRLNLKDGKFVGIQETFWENGQLKARWNCNDEGYDGVAEKWHENGQLDSRTEYKDGEPVGVTEKWFPNGQMRERIPHKDGKVDGLCECWYYNGRLRERIQYEEGKRGGIDETWWENGNLRERETYKDGERNGPVVIWNEDGTISEFTQYKDGEKNGIYVRWDKHGIITEYSVRDDYRRVGKAVYANPFGSGSVGAKEWDKEGYEHTLPREEAEKLYAEKTAEVNAMLSEMGIPTNSGETKFSAEERELSDDDTRETISDIENPENDTRFSATERVATADEARERFGVELTPDDLASTSTKHGAMMKALRIATEKGAIPNMDSTELLSFLSDTWRNAPAEVKSSIWETFSESADPDIAREVEQSLAEYVSREVRGIELTDAQRTFLDNAAKTIADRLGISEDNAKYVLWQHVNADNGITTDAERLAMQNALGVTTPASDYEAGVQAETRYSVAKRGDYDSARAAYEGAIHSFAGSLNEVYVNEYHALEALVDAVAGQTGKPVEAWENPISAFNQLTSKIKQRFDNYMRRFYFPMRDTLSEIKRECNYNDEQMVEYVSLKHGLERNRVFHQREWDRAQEEENRKAEKEGREPVQVPEPEPRDYSGLTAWIDIDGVEKPTIDQIEEEARRRVDDYERTMGTRADDLWRAINAATEETLRVQLRAGLISREQYDRISGMFQYYVPLQGFAETTNEDKYHYMGEYYQRESGTLLKEAKGRYSKADNPFTRIGQNADRAIREAERNDAKRSLFQFLASRPGNDLTTTGDVWYVKTNNVKDGREVWEVAAPEFGENETAESMAKTMEDFEERMRGLEEQGLAKREANRFELGSNVVFTYNQDIHQHCIEYTQNGVRKRMYIKGDPRAAQAVNGLLRGKDNLMQQAAAALTRYCASIYTSLNPQFFVTNFARDIGFAMFNEFSKEGAGYTADMLGNAALATRIGSLARKFRDGTLNMDDEMERMYYEFAMNGGITGYSQMRSDEYFRRQIKNGFWAKWEDFTPVKALNHVTENGENLLRFASYITARKEGRGIQESIAKAKDVTVNFNRKGTDRMIGFKEAQRLMPGNRVGAFMLTACSVLGEFRPLWAFFNVAVQGVSQVVRNLKTHPGRAGSVLVGYFAMGLMNGIIHGAANAMFGGEPPEADDWYWNLTDYERRKNIIIPTGNGNYIKIPMSQELRLFYGLGDMLAGRLAHKTKQKDIFSDILGDIGDMLPVNPVGEGGVLQGIMPTMAAPATDVLLNTDYRGMKIVPDRYGSNKPKWKFAYSSTPKWAVETSRALNSLPGPIDWIRGRDKFEKDRATSGTFDISPEAIQHFAEGWMGGILTFASMTVETGRALISGEELNIRNVPFANRFYGRKRDYVSGAYLTEMNRYAKSVHDEVKTKIKAYMENDNQDALDELYNSKDYDIYQLYEAYGDNIKDATRNMVRAEDESERMDYIDERNDYLYDLATELEDILYGQ